MTMMGFGQSQAGIISLEDYRRFQRFEQERTAFFQWLEGTAARNAERNEDLTDKEVLAIIEEAKEEVARAAE